MITASCFRRSGSLLLTVLLLASLIACGGSTATRTEVSVIVTGLQIAPGNTTIPLGTTQQFTAKVTLSDGSTRDVTTAVIWTSSKTAVATISAAGLATGVAAGSTTITASFSGTGGTATASITLTVGGAALVSLGAITPASTTMPLPPPGTTVQYAVTGTFTDSPTPRLVTSGVIWSSSNTAVAAINAVSGLATVQGVGTTTITAAATTTSGPASATATLTVTAATLSGITVTASASSIGIGATQQFVAIGHFSDGDQDITATAAFASSNAAILDFAVTGVPGLAKALALGSVTVTASLSGVTSAPFPFTVTNATLVSITVTPANPSIAKGLTQAFTATALYSDGTTPNITASASWTSSLTTVATMAANVATAVNVGTATITATSNGISGSTTLTVTAAVLNSIAVSAGGATSVAAGLTQQFTATGTFTDGVRDITATASFASSDATVLAFTLPTIGLGSALKAGAVNVTASQNGVTSPNFAFTVNAAALVSIAVTPANPSKPKGLTQQFTATGTYTDTTTANITTSVTWSSSDTAVATIGASTGLATAASVGSATITATLNSINGSTLFTVTAAVITSIAITPTSPATLASGGTQAFTASGTFTDATVADVTTIVNWSSSNTAVATIGLNTGVATGGLTAGSTNISATDPTTSVVSNVVALTVKALVSIAVTPANSTIPLVSPPLPFTATGTFSDTTTANLTSQVTWSSTDALTVSISSSGVATPVGPGTVFITATDPTTGISGSTSLTVQGLVSRFAYVVSGDGTVTTYSVNASTGELRINGVVLSLGTDSRGVTLHPNGQFAYVTNCNCVGFTGPQPSGSVSVYSINSSGALAQVGGAPTPTGVAGVSGLGTREVTIVSPAASPGVYFLYTANNDSGDVSAFSINPDGTLSAVTGSPFASGAGARSLVSDPQGKYLYVANHGADTVSQFTINADGSLTAIGASAVATAPATGPRFVTVHPVGKVVYVVNDNGQTSPGTVQVYSVDNTGGLVTPPSSVATGTGPVDFTLHPNGRFAYVGNELSDNIFVYPVDPTTGALGAANVVVSTGAGTGPGTPLLDASGQHAYVGLGRRVIALFTVDSSTGVLTAMNTPLSPIRMRLAEGGAFLNGTTPVTFTPTFAFVANNNSNSITTYSIDGNPLSSTYGQFTGPGVDTLLNAAATNPNDITTTLAGNFLYTSNSNGSVSQYSVSGGALTEIPSLQTGVSHPNTVTVEASGRFAYVGNNGNTLLNIFAPINATTGALPAVTTLSTTGLGVLGVDIFPWAVTADPTGQFLFSANEFNSVTPYGINVSTGALTAGTSVTAVPSPANNTLTLAVAAHPSGRFVYALSEDIVTTSGSLTAFSVDASTGALTAVGSPLSIGQVPSAIAIDPSGRFAYVGYQSGNSVDAFLVDPVTGALTAIGSFKAKPPQPGPAKLNVDPSGNFLYVANTGANTVTAFQIDPFAGNLTQVGSSKATGAAPGGITVIGTIQ